MSPNAAFGARLRQLREAAALTQEELAARAGLTVKAVGALERGERRWPYPHTVRSLADALRLDSDGRAALVAAAQRPTAVAGPASAGVPVPPTPMVGRQAQLDEVLELVRSRRTRLVTLTGPGGVGKTRLALALAAELAADFDGAATVAELAPVRDPALVLPTIGRSLGLAPAGPGGSARGGGPARVRPSPARGAGQPRAPAVGRAGGGDLAGAVPGARADRHQPGPAAHRGRAGLSAGAVGRSHRRRPHGRRRLPAAQVFLARAQAVAPRVRLDPDTAPAIADICQRLDGLPLALELAAAHAHLLPPAALRDRLTSSLGLARSRELPERQRTMAATLDWSHDLLTRDEQRLLRRLSVFAGGFTLDAAAQVAGEEDDVLPALAGLVEQSLVLPTTPRRRGTGCSSPSASTPPNGSSGPVRPARCGTGTRTTSPTSRRRRGWACGVGSRPSGYAGWIASTATSGWRWPRSGSATTPAGWPGWGRISGSSGGCGGTPSRLSAGWTRWSRAPAPANWRRRTRPRCSWRWPGCAMPAATSPERGRRRVQRWTRRGRPATRTGALRGAAAAGCGGGLRR